MFQDIHNLIPKTIKSLNLENQTQAAHVLFLTKNFLQKNCPTPENTYKVISFKDKTLKIYCQHPVIAQEIQHLSKQLIKEIQHKAKQIKIEKIQTTTQFPQSENIN